MSNRPNRSARLIIENVKLSWDEWHSAVPVNIGDIMTGWEIIAGLPVEEQTQLNNSDLPQAMRDNIGNDFYSRKQNDLYGAYIRACESLYRWNGERWEVVNG